MLCCNFRAVPKPECNRAILSHRGGVDDRQPQLFIKLGDDEWSALDVLHEDLDGFCFAEPFPLGSLQFIHALRGFMVALKVGSVALQPFCLVDSCSGVIKDSFASFHLSSFHVLSDVPN